MGATAELNCVGDAEAGAMGSQRDLEQNDFGRHSSREPSSHATNGGSEPSGSGRLYRPQAMLARPAFAREDQPLRGCLWFKTGFNALTCSFFKCHAPSFCKSPLLTLGMGVGHSW